MEKVPVNIDPDRYRQRTSIDRSEENPKTIDRSKNKGIATKLATKLRDPEGLKFYEMVASQYSEYELDKAVEKALKYGKRPGAYFNPLISVRPRSS